LTYTSPLFHWAVAVADDRILQGTEPAELFMPRGKLWHGCDRGVSLWWVAFKTFGTIWTTWTEGTLMSTGQLPSLRKARCSIAVTS